MKDGWKYMNFGDVCKFVRGPFGGSLKKSNFKQSGFAVYEQQHAIKNQFTNIRYFIDKIKFEEMKRFELLNGDLIMSCSGTMGKIAIVPKNIPEGIINQALLKLTPNDSINIYFLKRWTESSNFKEQLAQKSKGSAIKNVASVKILKEIKVPIPPLSEQERIVAILDKAFENISKAKENAKINLKNAKEIFENHLNVIFANKGEGWIRKPIGEICDLMTGGTPSRSKKEYFENGDINWLVSGDVNKKEITNCEGKITIKGFNNSNTKYLPVNSIIIALNGQGKTRGTVALLRIKATCNQSLVSIYPKKITEIIPEYIFYNLESRYVEIRTITGDSGNDRRGLNMPLIRKIKIAYPIKINEQKHYTHKFKTLKQYTKTLEEKYIQKIYNLEELKQSILQKAFNGELAEAIQ